MNVPPAIDVFISRKSEDAQLAKPLYDFLKSKGLHVFDSNHSLQEMGDTDYSRSIDNALAKTEHLIVFGSSVKNFSSPWVEAEWRFFLNRKRSGKAKGNLLSVISNGLIIDELPPSLQNYEVLLLEAKNYERIYSYVKRKDKSDSETMYSVSSKKSVMNITKHKVAAIHYTLRDSQGNVLDSSEGRDPLYYLHGANNLIPGMEEGLEGRAKGDHLQLDVAPEKGYGKHDPKLVENVPRKAFGGQNIEVGMQFETNDGQVVTVTNVSPDTVTVDANHPLADQNLHFDVEVVDVREATADELAHGHVHGPGGAHH